jgi:stage IV sporulation protein FB
MVNPFAWSFPIGRLSGITMRVHIFFPVVAIALIMRASVHEKAAVGIWMDAAMIVGLLFLTVLLHEFGHCFAARRVGGDAQDILLWPLGGLAAVDVPHTPRANFLVAAAGPAVNFAICVGCALALAFCFNTAWQPPWNIFSWPMFVDQPGLVTLTRWSGGVDPVTSVPAVIIARLFWVSWMGFVINVVLVGFPLDGGRMFQALVWPYAGYAQSMRYAIYAGFVTMIVVMLASVVMNEVLPLLLAWFIFTACSQQWLMLEQGGEDSLFGYDFSQGYTSLERDQERDVPPPPPPPKKVGFFQGWLQRRAERKRQRDAERQEAEERRMDELLDKIQREGKHALTDEEQRFLKRVSERYKNRH